jgi:hypothetical protein
MANKRSGKVIGPLLALAALLTAGILGVSFYHSTASIHRLLTENHQLNQAVRNLTQETQIGYALLQSQERDQLGEVVSVVRLVQTAAGNPKEIVSEQLFTVRGDIVHFDALIVKFTDEYVKDGTERALYLWRRLYDEHTQPANGAAIEAAGTAPERYHAITRALRLNQRDTFWQAIWALADDAERLSDYGIKAVFGNAIYTRLSPGKVVLFKISPTGQMYPEVVDTY